jgi:transcriptional regulator with GAF, ATPase, and Fis domain
MRNLRTRVRKLGRPMRPLVPTTPVSHRALKLAPGLLSRQVMLNAAHLESCEGPGEAARGGVASPGPILGLDGGLRAIASVLDRVSASQSTVLLRGETGTGKELIAAEIHRRSGRAGTLVRTNCAALADGVLESELFGHEAGSFTGAKGSRLGRFEQAHGGTLFLDEIGDISARVQVALLRVLEDCEFQRVGGNRNVQVDVRIVAATHAPLEDKVRRGEFRADLFHRLQVVQLHLPPLRERRQDIAPLAVHFVRVLGERLGKQLVLLPAAVGRLETHDWPGNVRELRNVLERACVLAERVASIDAPHLELGTGAAAHRSGEVPTLRSVLDDVAREDAIRLLAALREARGSKTRAAEILKIPRTTLTDRLRRLEAGVRGVDGGQRPGGAAELGSGEAA